MVREGRGETFSAVACKIPTLLTTHCYALGLPDQSVCLTSSKFTPQLSLGKKPNFLFVPCGSRFCLIVDKGALLARMGHIKVGRTALDVCCGREPYRI